LEINNITTNNNWQEMTATIYKLAGIVSLLAMKPSLAFLPQPSVLVSQTTTDTSKFHQFHLHMMDPASIVDTASNTITMADSLTSTAAAVVSSNTNLLAFSDQGQNMAGMFFQASLLPYALFLYFLSFKANRISDLGNFGFQFLLLFVLSTIPGGIVTKTQYGSSLANVDWLHGGAEALLTVTNILIVRFVSNKKLTRLCAANHLHVCVCCLFLNSAGFVCCAHLS